MAQYHEELRGGVCWFVMLAYSCKGGATVAAHRCSQHLAAKARRLVRACLQQALEAYGLLHATLQGIEADVLR